VDSALETRPRSAAGSDVKAEKQKYVLHIYRTRHNCRKALRRVPVFPMSNLDAENGGSRSTTSLGGKGQDPSAAAGPSGSRSVRQEASTAPDRVSPTSEPGSSPDSAASSSIQPGSSFDEEAPLSFSSASDRESSQQPPSTTVQQSIPIVTTAHGFTPPPLRSRQAIHRPGFARSGSDPQLNRPSTSVSHIHAEGSHARAGPVAGPSSTSHNRMRYADPDQHWLSEDEGSTFSRDVRRTRRQQRLPSGGHGRGGGGGGGSGSDGKDTDPDKDQSLYLTGETRTRHPISNKPATVSKPEAIQSKDSASLLPEMASVMPNLLTALECPTCTNIMQDPITLVCGHSLCLSCSVSETANKSVRSTPPFAPIVARADLPEHEDLEGHRDVLALPTVAEGDIKSKIVMSDAICPLSSCRKVTKARSGGRMGLRTDYVLQKLTTLVDAQLKMAEQEADDSGVGVQLVAETDGDVAESVAVTLAQNLHNSSPDEEVKAEDSMKRAMGRRRSPFVPNKKKTRAGGAQSPSLVLTLVSDILSELECQVCVTLLYEPLTSPCGHTFCKRCLFRSLDHSNRCPLCRTELPGFGFFLTAPFNQTISNLLITTFPLLHAERRDLILKEEGDSGLDTPVFVCMVAFPHMPTNLHIYEPRYRLMMRRAMDSNKRFGMVLPSRTNGGFSQYGTMLEIQNISLFEDGRSLVETVGVYRFKILESGTLDGYNVGRVERIEDIEEEEGLELERLALARSAVRHQEERQRAKAAHEKEVLENEKAQPRARMPGSIPPPSIATPAHTSQAHSAIPGAPTLSDPTNPTADDSVELTNAQLLEVCKGFVEALRTGSTPWLLQRLSSSLPPMPEDAREFTWWMAMLMPVDDHEKAKLLQITSYRLRLRLLVFWIQQMQGSWWFSRGCTIC